MRGKTHESGFWRSESRLDRARFFEALTGVDSERLLAHALASMIESA
jgi:hypothetical protein